VLAVNGGKLCLVHVNAEQVGMDSLAEVGERLCRPHLSSWELVPPLLRQNREEFFLNHLFISAVPQLNGRRVRTPLAIEGGAKVLTSGIYTLLDTSFGLQVKFDGVHHLEVVVPGEYFNKVGSLEPGAWRAKNLC